MTTTDNKITPVLLAGGAGSRLWPVSRDQLPKQFQPLVGSFSTYQQTLKRVSDRSLFDVPKVITSHDFRFFAKRQAEDIGTAVDIILEPVRRDSAAAIAAAALVAERDSPGGLVMALAADHIILDEDKFNKAVMLGRKSALDGNIVVFGLPPTEPQTSFGYISPGAPFGEDTDLRCVNAFVEKPNAETALEYLEKGYLWNSGNFLFRSDRMISEFQIYAPEILSAVERSIERSEIDLGFRRLDQESFEACPKDSVDYAVIEKTKKIAVVRGHFRWSDVGSWDAIWAVADKDDGNNAIEGDGLLVNSNGCLVHSNGLTTTVVGANNLVVVSTKDAVLVVPKSQAQEVKGLVEHLKLSGRGEITDRHKRTYSPWGYAEEMLIGERFGVKRIVIDPGCRTSLQRHINRAEHWIVVGGTATVTIGTNNTIIAENESIYVPVGQPHRIANQGRIALELIEVRTGAYIGDDDVVRIEDDFTRVENETSLA